jgi:hypothetical protein
MKLLLIMLLAFTGMVTAQTTTQTNNEGYVGYQFLRQDVKFERPSFTFQAPTDSHGVNVSYTRYLAKKGEVGNVGLTVDVGANFKNDEVPLATLMGGVTFKARNQKYVQPFARGLVGVARENITVSNLPVFNRADYSAAFALGGGLDFNVKAHSRYKIRLGADYLNTGFDGARQNAVRLSTGLVF